MSIRNMFLSGLFTLTVTACSNDLFLVHNGNMPSTEKISQINKGQTRQQVAQILGSPSSVTSFDGENWIYMSSTLKKVAFFKPEEIDRQILEINFNSAGQVADINTYNQNDGVKQAIDRSETVTDGHNIGFFRKYFGGVGAFMPIAPTKSGDNI